MTLLDLVWDHLVDPVWLDALATEGGDLHLPLLPEVVGASDVIVGQYLDEELCAFARIARRPDRHWTPWLHARAPESRAVAQVVVDRLHLANDIVTDVGDGTGLVQADLQVVADTLDVARRQIVWTHHRGDAVVGRAGLLVVDDKVVLHDIHDGNGVHLLVIRSVDRARHVVGDALALRAVDAAHVDACHLGTGAVWSSDSPQRTIVVQQSEDGPVVTDSTAGPGSASVGAPDIDGLAASLLAS